MRSGTVSSCLVPSISRYRSIALMRIAPKKKTSYVHASQLSIQTTECLAISLVMQQNAETWLGLFMSHLWLKCSLALAGACIKHQREIHFPPCCGVFTVITGGFDPPMEKEINKFITSYLSISLSIHIQVAHSLRSLATCSPIAPTSAYALMGGAISPLILWLLQFRLFSFRKLDWNTGMA